MTLAVQIASADLAYYHVYFKISDPVIEPGEKQTIELWGRFHGEWSDGLGGEWFGAPGFMLASEFPVKYYSLGYFGGDLLNTKNGGAGVLGKQYFNLTLASTPGTVTPSNDILDIYGWAPPPPSPWVLTGNPVFLWKADWTPTSYDNRVVKYEFVPGADTYAVVVAVPQGLGGFGYGSRKVAALGDSVSFKVVPAPGVMPFTLAAGAVIIRRRRATT